MTTAPPGSLTVRGRRTRATLVAAAREVFGERGWSGTRMADVAEAAGVSHGTVYTYFAAKDDLLRAVVGETIGEVYLALRTDDATTDEWSVVRQANLRYLHAWDRNRKVLEVVEEAAATDPSFADLLADLRRMHVDRVTSRLELLLAARLADPAVTPRAAAAALCSMVEGFARHWVAPAGPYDLESAADLLTAVWGRAVGLRREPLDGPLRAGDQPDGTHDDGARLDRGSQAPTVVVDRLERRPGARSADRPAPVPTT